MATLEVALELRCRRGIVVVAFLDVRVDRVDVVVVMVNVRVCSELRPGVRVCVVMIMVMLNIHSAVPCVSAAKRTEDRQTDRTVDREDEERQKEEKREKSPLGKVFFFTSGKSEKIRRFFF